LEENSIIFFARLKKIQREKKLFRDQKPTACFFSSFVGDFCNFCHFLVLHRERERERERSNLEIQNPLLAFFIKCALDFNRARFFLRLLFPKTFLGEK
jgi:hypothetical protein